MTVCGAKKKQGPGTCQQKAGWGTDHLGEGRCKLHGGKSLVKHGKFSTVTRQPLREAIQEAEQNPDPLNVLPEMAKARGVLNLWLTQYGRLQEVNAELRKLRREKTAALKAKDADAVQAADARIEELVEEQDGLTFAHPDRVLAALDLISKIQDRLVKQKNAGMVSRKDLGRILQEFSRCVDRHVHDEGAKARIAKDFSQVRL